MTLTLGKKIGGGFALVLVAFAIFAIVAFRQLADLIETERRVLVSREIIGQIVQINASVSDVQSAVRGYVLTGEEALAEGIQWSRIDLTQSLDKLRLLTAGDVAQQGWLNRLSPLTAEFLELYEQRIETRKVGGFDAAVALAKTGKGQQAFEEILALLAEMKDAEERLLETRTTAAHESVKKTREILIVTAGLALAFGLGAGIFITRRITGPIGLLVRGAGEIGRGSFSHRVRVTTGDQLGQLAEAFNQMAGQLETSHRTMAAQDWVKTSLVRITGQLQGKRDLGEVGTIILAELAALLSVPHALYFARKSSDTGWAELTASYGHAERAHLPQRFAAGEGLVGQCLVGKRRILLDEVPAGYVRIRSGLGEAEPRCIAVQPVLFEGEVLAVIELATLQRLDERALNFLDQFVENLGPALQAIAAAALTDELLAEAEQRAQEMTVQAEELNEANRGLDVKNRELNATQTRLTEQQAELEALNTELEEKANVIEEQYTEVRRQKFALEEAETELRAKAAELELTSRYKSDFLSNMSHELRTPLNSLMILSQMLGDNTEGTLTPKQVEWARTIHGAGGDLLALISDVLDLAKIEAGKLDIESSEAAFGDVRSTLERTFAPVAEKRALAFDVRLAPELPPSFQTDAKRLLQILKNLLANAFKFTERGSVTLTVAPEAGGFSFEVRDTGIGIPTDKQQAIFEAFQQAEAGTSRKYGGTGLGLSISRELARLLGGAITIQSTPGAGSVFTLHLPGAIPAAGAEPVPRPVPAAPRVEPKPEPPSEEIVEDVPFPGDDSASLAPGDQVLLIVEDDEPFARVLMDLARERGFKCIVATTAAAAERAVRRYTPAAITLDVHLPDRDGMAIFDRWKHDDATRHIPVHFISADAADDRGMRLGALGWLQKPVTREALTAAIEHIGDFVRRSVRRLLVVEGDEAERRAIADLIGNGDVVTTAVGTGAEALAAIEAGTFDCVVLDLGLPDMRGAELIRRIRALPGGELLPIIIHTGQAPTPFDEAELNSLGKSLIIKDARSPERLLDETALFLHRVQSRMPAAKRELLHKAHLSDPGLAGRTALVVDDDVRNVFALTAALERLEMRVLPAENGLEALAQLERNPHIDVVLMDVMMPEMDGLECTRRIRADARWKNLPVIAVTTKAMKGSREQCLDAGASDYIAKPVDMDQLRSLLRVWLYR